MKNLREKALAIMQSHDTVLAPVIARAIYRSIRETKKRHCYSVLCVLTSGESLDVKQATEAIYQAAVDAPLSIIFIGCGRNDNLESLRHFVERTKLQQSISGVKISGNNTQFASFCEFENDPCRVVEYALSAIPEQVLHRLHQMGTAPRPPPKDMKPPSSYAPRRNKCHNWSHQSPPHNKHHQEFQHSSESGRHSGSNHLTSGNRNRHAKVRHRTDKTIIQEEKPIETMLWKEMH
jgi:hypothetical protein